MHNLGNNVTSARCMLFILKALLILEAQPAKCPNRNSGKYGISAMLVRIADCGELLR